MNEISLKKNQELDILLTDYLNVLLISFSADNNTSSMTNVNS